MMNAQNDATVKEALARNPDPQPRTPWTAEQTPATLDEILGDAYAQAPCPGEKIRVIRVLVYEGNAAEIGKVLAKSLPHGTRECTGYTITVLPHSTTVVGGS